MAVSNDSNSIAAYGTDGNKDESNLDWARTTKPSTDPDEEGEIKVSTWKLRLKKKNKNKNNNHEINDNLWRAHIYGE